jgi:hypothetical protein
MPSVVACVPLTVVPLTVVMILERMIAEILQEMSCGWGC